MRLYKVICDETTNLPERVARNELGASITIYERTAMGGTNMNVLNESNEIPSLFDTPTTDQLREAAELATVSAGMSAYTERADRTASLYRRKIDELIGTADQWFRDVLNTYRTVPNAPIDDRLLGEVFGHVVHERLDRIKKLLSILYCSLGAAGEAGELANKAKKLLRDGLDDVKLDAMGDESGDVLWYLAMLGKETGRTLSHSSIQNIEKLAKRAATGTLGGSGDTRQDSPDLDVAGGTKLPDNLRRTPERGN